MSFPTYFEPKNSLSLYGFRENLLFLKKLYTGGNLPKVLMFSGKKGLGKSTLANHLMFFIYDKKNYDEENQMLSNNSNFYNHFIDNTFPNIVYLSGSNFKNIKIEDIRNLKKKIFQTSLSNQPRFIILDDVELFNVNSLNALLKIIEEPSKMNYFLLINNKTKPLLDTIKSRCLEIKFIINNEKRIEITESLIKDFNLDLKIDLNNSNLTPGYFIKFNYICNENKINLDDDFLKNLTTILNLYKKNKDIMYIDMILFLTDYYFNEIKINKSMSNEKIIDYKRFIFENINNFFLYNLNQNALLNVISNKICNE